MARAPNALSRLATGRPAAADASLLSSIDGENGRYVDAILALAKGDRAKAGNLLGSLDSEYAKLILEFWNSKENN